MKIKNSLATILAIVSMSTGFIFTSHMGVNASASTTASVQIKLQPSKADKAEYQKNAITTLNSKLSAADRSAKVWIANNESHGSYTANNGIYYGKYQIQSKLLHGNYSALNQEKAADNYVKSRYGSWSNAKRHWLQNHWY